MKKILFVLNKPPYGSTDPQESLDMAMTAAAFDQDVSILLLDDGVFLLKAGQRPENIGQKPVSAMFGALPLYGVETVYAETESLLERGLSGNQLSEAAVLLDRQSLGDFFRRFNHVVHG